MDNVIKICFLKFSQGNIVQEYYVFSEHITDINQIFDKDEIKYIRDKKISVNFIEKSIHPDDTIDIIKRKIMEHIINISFEEIYIFGISEKDIDTFAIYNELTQNEKIKLTKAGLYQFLQNFHQISINDLPHKEIYDYEDLLMLKLDEKKQRMKIPLGQEFIIDNSYHYTINPFDTILFAETLKEYAQEVINTAPNRNLLFTSGKLHKNTIFLCAADNVLEYSKAKSLSQELFIKVYFPLLFHHSLELDSLRKLQNNQITLRSDSRKNLLNKTYKDINDDVDTFYNIFWGKKTDLKYNSKGIKEINFIIKTDYRILVPLEIIFKLLHTSEKIPLIKYNPGNRFENIYRLYAKNKSHRGKKIPFLSKSKIIKLRKNIGKHKQVSVYVSIQNYEIICSFEKNGDIHIDLDLSEVISLETAEKIIKQAIKPLLSTVGNFLGQSGYSYLTFNKLDDPNIIIKNITYISSIPITKKFNIKNFQNCISSIFNIMQSNLKDGVILRFKRTSYFKKEESKQAYIIEMIQKEQKFPEIIEGLVQNFKMSKIESTELLQKFLREVEIHANLHGERKLKIRSNPGFPVFIRKMSFENTIILQVNNINHIGYLKVLPIYLDTLIRLTQDIKSTSVPQETIDKFCRIAKAEIVAAPELPAEVPEEQEPYKQDESDDDDEAGFFDWDSDSNAEDGDVQPEIIGEEEKNVGNDVQPEIIDEDGAPAPEEEGAPAVQQAEEAEEVEDVGEVAYEQNEDEEEAAEEVKPVVKQESRAKKLWRQAQEEQDAETDDEDKDKDKDEGKDEGKDENDAALEQLDIEDEGNEGDDEGEVDEDEADEGEGDEEDAEVANVITNMAKVAGISKEKDVNLEIGENLEFGENFELGENLEEGEVAIQQEADQQEADQQEAGQQEADQQEADQQEAGQQEADQQEEGDEENLDFGENFELGNFSNNNNDEDNNDEIGGNIGFNNMEGGGVNSNNNLESDITGFRLAHPNPFQERMKRLDKALFLKPKQKGFSAYSRICPSNVKRQPVILTDKEKERIDRDHKGSYSYALKYGSSPDKQYWYICPRYWCLTGNYSLTEDEVKAGVCGGEAAIIPQNATVVPEGGQIYEFSSSKFHKKDGKYVHHGPGFTKGNKIHKNLCVPCCFKNWNSKIQQVRRKHCQENTHRTEEVAIDDYIKGGEKFPLAPRRWGFLPLSIQKFLQTDNKKCLSKGVKRELKENHMCFLRQGILLDSNQSFIVCIADIYSKMTGSGGRGGLLKTHMKEIIIDSLSVTNFKTFKRGTLVENFAEVFINDKTKYEEKVQSALNNFSDFLRDEEIEINYEYIWDIISRPNPKLFENGLNIIILNVPDDDVTDNIEVICSTDMTFDLKKPSVFIMKRDNLYEPIYGYTPKNESIVITPSFLYDERGISPNIKKTLLYLSEISVKCASLPSLPRIYNFQDNISLKELIKNIDKINYTILKQIVNFNSKTIGLIIQNNTGVAGFIPCKPSSISQKYEYVFMDDDNLWNNYKTTIDFLKEVYILSEEKIPCKAQLKVEEDGFIVGILTITNQFIPLSRPNENIRDELEVIKGYNFLLNDKEMLFNEEVDDERILMSKMVSLETKFYNIFRNTVRILLQQYRNKKYKNTIEEIIKTSYILYKDKLEQITNILKDVLRDHIKFVTLSPQVLRNIEVLSTCLKSEDCDKTHCLSEEGSCKLLIPDKHLISKHDNKEIYFGRMADELIRFGRIRLFIFKPRNFISFQKVNYNLHKNEIILLEHLLDEEYWKDIHTTFDNPYLRNKKSFDYVQPYKTVAYSSKIDSSKHDITENKEDVEGEKGEKEEEGEEEEEETKCVRLKRVKGKEWKKMFTSFQSIFFENIAVCTWQFVAYILQTFLNKNIELPEVKQILLDEYTAINDWDKVSRIFEVQGKLQLITSVKRASFEDVLQSENYYITNLDLFLFIKKYKIPTIFISGAPGGLKETGAQNRKKIISFLYSSSQCCIIRTPGLKRNKPGKYSVLTKNGKIFFKMEDLPDDFKPLIAESKVNLSFDDYYKRVTSKKFKLTKQNITLQ